MEKENFLYSDRGKREETRQGVLKMTGERVFRTPLEGTFEIELREHDNPNSFFSFLSLDGRRKPDTTLTPPAGSCPDYSEARLDTIMRCMAIFFPKVRGWFVGGGGKGCRTIIYPNFFSE